MKKIFTAIFLMFFAFSVQAKDFELLIPVSAGSTTDTLAKAIFDEYSKITGEKYTKTNAPGPQAIGGSKWLTSGKNTVYFGVTTSHVYGPLMDSNLPYSDNDFRYIAFVGFNPAIYISNPASGIKTPQDLINKLPNSDKPFIGGYAHAFNLSVEMLKSTGKLDKKVSIVGHKGGPKVILNVLNGSVPVGLVSVSGNLLQLVKQGKLNIIGQSGPNDIEIQGVKMPSISKALDVPQTKGGFIVSVKPNAGVKFIKNFEENLRKAIASQSVQDTMKKLNVTPAGIFGTSATLNQIKSMRSDVTKLVAITKK